MSSDNGWPMPPAPPNTVTFDACLAEAEKALRWQALKMCREANMADYIEEEVVQGMD